MKKPMIEELELNNNQKATLYGLDYFKNPVYELEDKMKVSLVDEKLYTLDRDLKPEIPLKNEYQINKKIPDDYDILKDIDKSDNTAMQNIKSEMNSKPSIEKSLDSQVSKNTQKNRS